VPAVDEIVVVSEDGTRTNRKIQYVPGESSIFADEQSKEAKPATILIQGNLHFVTENQPNKLKYLRMCNYNLSNPNRRTDINGLIREYDRAAIFQKGLDEKDLIMDARFKVKEMDIDELKAFLLVVSDNPASVTSLNSMSVQEIRHTAYNVAEKNPKKFLEDITDVKSKDKLVLMKAIAGGHIIHSASANTLSWADGAEIVRFPHGFNIIEVFIEKAHVDAKYSDIMDMIKDKMRMPDVKTVVASPQEADMFVTAIEKGVTLGLVEKRGVYLTYQDVEYQGVKNLKAALKDNKMLLFGELMTSIEESSDSE
jgi:hypothetical protein